MRPSSFTLLEGKPIGEAEKDSLVEVKRVKT